MQAESSPGVAAPAPETTPSPPAAATGSRLREFAGRWEALLIGLILVTCVVGQGLSTEFLTTDSFTTQMPQIPVGCGAGISSTGVQVAPPSVVA